MWERVRFEMKKRNGNFKLCTPCKLQMHKRCSGIPGKLTKKKGCICGKCTIVVNNKSICEINSFKVQDNFCCKNEIIRYGDGFSKNIIDRVKKKQDEKYSGSY